MVDFLTLAFLVVPFLSTVFDVVTLADSLAPIFFSSIISSLAFLGILSSVHISNIYIYIILYQNTNKFKRKMQKNNKIFCKKLFTFVTKLYTIEIEKNSKDENEEGAKK